MWVSGQRHAPGKTRSPGWAPGSVWKGADNLASTGIRFPECAARTKSLYRLSCPGPRQTVLKHYQNKWPENLERIPKMLCQRMRNPEYEYSVPKIPELWISDPESAATCVYHAEDGGNVTQKYGWIISTYC